MRKRLSALLLMLAVICTQLTGCHGSKERIAFQVPESFDESKSYELTFWAKNDTNKAQVAVYEQVIADFEALYPNIRINLRLYTDYSKLYNDVISNIATNTTPNICITYPDHIATYLTGEDVMVPLDDLFTDKKYGLGGSELHYDGVTQAEIDPKFLSEGIISGHYYDLPFMRSTEACYINKTYVEKLGYTIPEQLTWDFIWEVSEAAMAKDSEDNFLVNGQKVMIPCIYYSTDNMMIQLLRQNGAGYSTSAGEIQIFNDTTKEILYTVAEHAATRAFSTFKISSYPANFLNAGQCIFAIDSTGGSTWMGSDAPLLDIAEEKIVRFETEVKMLPQVDWDNPQMISQGPSVCLFNKEDQQEVLASWLFMQYLLTDKTQIAYSQTEGFVPVTLRARETAEYQDYLAREGEDNTTHYAVKIQAAKLLLANVENTFITPVFNGSASLRSAAGQLVENVAKSVRRKETVDEAYMEKLFADVTSLYRLDQLDGNGQTGKTELGPLPKTSVALLCCLGGAWVLLGVWAGVSRLKKKKR